MRRSALLALAAAAALASGYVLAVFAATALPDATDVERAFEAQGATAERATASVGAVLAARPQPPEAIVAILHRAPVVHEQEILLEYVASGGVLVLVSEAPEWLGAHRPADLAIAVLPGRVVDAEGGAARLLAPDGATFEAHGFRALDLGESRLAPLLTSADDAFRDANGNGRLEIGETGGPFTVAAQAQVGDGRLVVVAASALRVPPEVVPVLVGDDRVVRHVLVLDDDATGAWTGVGRALVLLAGLPATSVGAAAVAFALAAGGGFLLMPTRPFQKMPSAIEPAVLEAYRSRLRAGPRPSAPTAETPGDHIP